MRRKVAVVTGEVLGAQLAGPAIRAWHLADALAAEHDVQLLTTAMCTRGDDAFRCSSADGDALGAATAGSDVIIVQGDALSRAPAIARSDAVVVVDLYDPFHLEALEQSRVLDRITRRARVQHAVDVLDAQLRRGDHFLCASDRQRDFWIGHLAALGRVNEVVYDASPDLSSLISVVPFGTEEQPPARTAPGIRGVVAGIGADDDVLLWGGGIYDWFDPLTLVRAVADLRSTRPNIRLFFAGARHPNPAVGETEAARATRELADDLGLTGRHVFFHDWVEYDARADYLLDADVAVCTARDHVEAAYSFRTRLLDAFWAGLPVVTTAGDTLADRVQERGAGVVVPVADARALADALGDLLDDRTRRDAAAAASRALGTELAWPRVLEPVLELCRDPRRSPDLLDPAIAAELSRAAAGHAPPGRLSTAYRLARSGDWEALRRKVARRVRRPS